VSKKGHYPFKVLATLEAEHLQRFNGKWLAQHVLTCNKQIGVPTTPLLHHFGVLFHPKLECRPFSSEQMEMLLINIPIHSPPTTASNKVITHPGGD
jgi:hypothetical protein